MLPHFLTSWILWTCHNKSFLINIVLISVTTKAQKLVGLKNLWKQAVFRDCQPWRCIYIFQLSLSAQNLLTGKLFLVYKIQVENELLQEFLFYFDTKNVNHISSHPDTICYPSLFDKALWCSTSTEICNFFLIHWN